MKKQFLFLLLCALVSLNSKAQSSISFTTVPTTVNIGTFLTVNYKYTSTTNVNIACGINLRDGWEWISYVGGHYRIAPPGTDVEGTFSFLIPAGTTSSDDLTGNLNYKIIIELKDPLTNAWITGVYPATPIVLTRNSKIYFSYDGEGNQTERNFVLMSTSKMTNKTTKEIVALNEDVLQKLPVDDGITYYPNPVKDDLFLQWELSQDNAVASIHVYDLNGHLVQSYSNGTRANSQTISFLNYPTGVYAVVLLYSNGKQKSIKIIKQ
jgi:hypothetical protein